MVKVKFKLTVANTQCASRPKLQLVTKATNASCEPRSAKLQKKVAVKKVWMMKI